jgi:hypothetical protein
MSDTVRPEPSCMEPQLTGLTPFASTVGCPAWLLAADVGRFPAAMERVLVGAPEVEVGVADAVLVLALVLAAGAAVEAVELAPCPHAVSSIVPAATAMETRASRRLVTITLPLWRVCNTFACIQTCGLTEGCLCAFRREADHRESTSRQ